MLSRIRPLKLACIAKTPSLNIRSLRNMSTSEGEHQIRSVPLLQRTENDLKEYCEETNTSKDVLDWYTEKTRDLQARCKSDADPHSMACDALNAFESIIRELQGCGIKSTLHTLECMKKMEQETMSVKIQDELQRIQIRETEQQKVEQKRNRIEQMFLSLGKSLDGHITALDIQAALPKISGRHLMDNELEAIVEALEGKDSLHFGLTIDEFMAILDKTSGWDEQSDAQFLMHMPHMHHHSIPHTPIT